MKQYKQKEIYAIISNPVKAFQAAQDTNINVYILDQQNLLFRHKSRYVISSFPNILAEMLQIDERQRVSSLKLASFINAQELLINAKIQDPLGQIYDQDAQLIRDVESKQSVKIVYPLRRLVYEGEVVMRDKVEREGQGTVKQDQKVMYEGRWKNDMPEGWGRFQLYAGKYVYEGCFQHGQMQGEGTIFCVQADVKQAIYAGYFYRNICLDWVKQEQELRAPFQMFKKSALLLTYFPDCIHCDLKFLYEICNTLHPQHYLFLAGRTIKFTDTELQVPAVQANKIAIKTDDFTIELPQLLKEDIIYELIDGLHLFLKYGVEIQIFTDTLVGLDGKIKWALKSDAQP